MKTFHPKPYPYYKPSDVEWLGDVPAHWAIERAKWLFEKMERPVREEDEVVTCFRDGVVTLRKNRRVLGFTESLKEIGYQGIRRGDLVIHAMDAFAGAIGVADADGKGTPVYSVCKPEPWVNAYFYAYILREMARNQWIQALAKGIRERSSDFRYTEFALQPVPVPPLSEQAAIVRYLDHTDERIRRYVSSRERFIELLEEYRQAVIHHAVTRGLNPDVRLKPSGVEWMGDVPAHWEVLPLKHWLGMNEAVLSEATDPNFEFRYIDIGSVGTGVLIEKPQKIRFATAPSRARRIVRDGDTIISTVRTYLKAVWFAEETKGNFICSTGFVVLTPRQGTLPKFVSYLTQNNSFIDRVTANSVGTAYPAITESRLGSFQVAVPPFPEQAAIIAYLNKATANIDADIDRAWREIELLGEYRTRLIADVVTGKVDVHEATAELSEPLFNGQK